MSKKKLLVIGYVWPEPKSSAAGARMMQLLEFFLAEAYSVTFATTASETEYMADLSGLGITSEKIELNNESFDIFLKKISPEIVIFDRFMMEEQFGWRVAEVVPEAIRILDTEDLHFLRKARQEALKTGKELTASLLFSDTAKREIASIYRCDLSLIISPAEIKLLTETFGVPQNILFYLPFMLQEVSEEKKSRLLKFDERRDFISIGNFLHEPNKDAVLQLKREIWPLVRAEIKEAKIHIFGAYVPQHILELHHEKEGFLVHGRAVSAKEEIGKARILLAPIRFGAGIKGKFTDAMQVGTPAVTTNLGAEGMGGENEWNGAIADSPEIFAEAAVDLYKNEELWKKAQENGYKILDSHFSEAVHSERLQGKLREISETIEEHRNSNFTGLMLQHQNLSSTKYLSKYIEAKNKNRP
ncbi:glycosyltransferase family 4 protein [Salinimicrobium xinjiangense]|uniref:glycosyltransferase family 4 protein n=1 Tax=Salinimicrobium xinjiangense TaxID=438596 RepID=UPI0004022558|nr:glycosyltransferase family 4 protein [Salinimicrobium xinjiangense]